MKRPAMNFTHSYQAASEWRDCARRRYHNRALLCSLPRASAEEPQPLLSAEGFNLSASRPVQPGRGLLLKLQGADEGSTRTLLARVASADRRADGSWLVRCRFAGTPAS
jgi:hypothetical protein